MSERSHVGVNIVYYRHGSVTATLITSGEKVAELMELDQVGKLWIKRITNPLTGAMYLRDHERGKGSESLTWSALLKEFEE